MKHRPISLPCGFQEDALIAVALDEADAALRQAVHTHIRLCQACCGVFARYCGVQQVLTALQTPRDVEESLERAQEKLTHRLVRSPVVQSSQTRKCSQHSLASCRRIWREPATACPGPWMSAVHAALFNAMCCI